MVTVYIALATEALRFANNLLEGTPVHLRQAQALQTFWLTWPIFKGMFSIDRQKQIEALIDQFKPQAPETPKPPVG